MSVVMIVLMMWRDKTKNGGKQKKRPEQKGGRIEVL